MENADVIKKKGVEYGTIATKPSIITVQASNMRAYLTNKRLAVVNTSLGCDYRPAEKQKSKQTADWPGKAYFLQVQPLSWM